ncbi:MAG: hypothetical protein R3E57_05685 [Porticoccaceae bacterium]
METLNLITPLEGELKAAVTLLPHGEHKDCWLLEIALFHSGDPAGTTSFNLNGYSREEAEDIARNIKSNPFLMREIDEHLWGDSD